MHPFRLVLGLSILFSFSAVAQNLDAWAEKISVNGDFRFRHDYNSRANATDTSEAHKERLRARVGVQAQVNETTKVRVRLTTAEGGNSISGNQTMTGNSDKKTVYFDLAMVDWNVFEDANLLLGKMENPLRPVGQSQLIYDSDYTPEGLALTAKPGSMFVSAAVYSIQERAPQNSTPNTGTSEPDSALFAGLVGFKTDNPDGMNFMVAGGYHFFTALKKNSALSTGFLGNSNVGGRYLHDYQMGEVAAELKWKQSTYAYGIFVDAIQNFYADEDNTGFLAGLQFQTSGWTVAYAYMGLDKNATVSAINNSDWGNGNDGGFGHMGQVAKTINANTSATLTWFHMNVDNNGTPYGTERVLADLLVTF